MSEAEDLLSVRPRATDYEFSLRISRRVAITNAANRLLFSKAYSIFYILIIVLNLALLIWIIANASVVKSISSPGHWLFGFAEIVINLALFFEVALRMAALGKKYFSNWSNVFDLVVLMLSFIGLLLYFQASGSFGEANDITTTALLFFRYFIQLVRLVVMIRNQRKNMSTQPSSILLDQSDDDDEEEEEDEEARRRHPRTGTENDSNGAVAGGAAGIMDDSGLVRLDGAEPASNGSGGRFHNTKQSAV